MSLSTHTSAHLKADSAITAHAHTGKDGSGYVRISPNDSAYAGISIHADIAGLRRIAAACLALADELESPTPATDEPCGTCFNLHTYLRDCTAWEVAV